MASLQYDSVARGRNARYLVKAARSSLKASRPPKPSPVPTTLVGMFGGMFVVVGWGSLSGARWSPVVSELILIIYLILICIS